jgi:hypothetical protein
VNRSPSHCAAINGAANPANVASSIVPGPSPNTAVNKTIAAQQHSGIDNSATHATHPLTFARYGQAVTHVDN